MNVTLVYRGRYWVRQALDLETLAAVLRSGGHSVRLVYDPDVFGVSDNVLQIEPLARLFSSPESIGRRTLAGRPDAVCFSVLPGTYAWSRSVATQIRRRSRVPIICTGLHPSLVPDRLADDPCFDYIIEGEVEAVINPLLQALASGRSPCEVANLRYRDGGEVVTTPRAAPVDLDALPLPDKELFAPHVTHGLSYVAMVSRGCPYQCSFCEETCARSLYGPAYYRRKRVETVMAELLAGRRRYHFREVIFKDSYLSGNKVWLAELMDRYRREIRVPFKCFCTIHGFDREIARLLKEGGCYSIEFGLQTWNDRVRRDVLRRAETSEQAREAFAACAESRLWYDVDHMFGLPTETREDHVEGAREYSRLRYLNRVKVHHLVYLPTAPIVKNAVACHALAPDAEQRLADGEEGDFYAPSSGSGEDRRLAAAFAALYKLLPVLPERLLRRLLENDNVLWLGRVPKPVVIAIQGLMAIRSGDLRFLVYLGLYPAKVCRAVAARMGDLLAGGRAGTA